LPSGFAAALLAAWLTPAADPQTRAAAPKPAPKAARKSAPAANAATIRPRPTPQEFVAQALEAGVRNPVENPAALVPFFEQLYRHQRGEHSGPVRILQYGDSHTAADELSGQLRNLFQASFGNGGSGFSIAGQPFKSYRRLDVKSGSSLGWRTDGLVSRAGDGIYGLGGVSLTASAPRESLFLEADAAEFELYYYQQPGGGSLRLYDSGAVLDLISTDGAPGPAYYRVPVGPGPHRFEIETLGRDPVRLFGWVAENPTGVTYESFGLNGAQATTAAQWDAATLREHMEHHPPDLIVVAYGTNEAGNRRWTLESYQAEFTRMLRQFRAAAPAASILVVGPPDRAQRIRRQWQPMARVGIIAEAQRRAAWSMGCAFIDLRQEMGGPGAMQQWVKAGQAQADHVHFTRSGYRLLGGAIFTDIMNQYWAFLRARAEIMAQAFDGPPGQSQ
jgi:lysophospholipase L1-like esterase